MEYTLATKNSLVEGYKNQGPGYFYSFIALNIIAAVVNTAGVLLLTASLLHYALPISIPVTLLCWVILAVCLIILLLGHFKALDNVAKAIMGLLTIATITALVIAINNGPVAPVNYVGPSPYELAMLGFMVVFKPSSAGNRDQNCVRSLACHFSSLSRHAVLATQRQLACQFLV